MSSPFQHDVYVDGAAGGTPITAAKMNRAGVELDALDTLLLYPTGTKTAAYTAAVKDDVLCDATSGAFTVTLPAAPVDGSEVMVKKIDNTSNIVTVACGGSDTFAVGGTTLALAVQGHAATFRYQASTGHWITVNNDLPFAQTELRYGARALKQRDMRNLTLPRVASSPPTVSTSAAGASSTITSAVRINCDNAAAFSIHGAQMVNGNLIGGNMQSLVAYGASTGAIASPSPFVVEFELDSVGGTVEIISKDFTGQAFRVAVDGAYCTAGATFTAPGTSASWFNGIISGLSAGTHVIRCEFKETSNFGGINVGPTDTVRALPKPPLLVYVVGDSFTEPTMQDSTAGAFAWGWVQVLSQITGLEIRSSGSGGTGYLNPGSSGRVKFRDRLQADVLSQNPDIIIWAGGINDQSYSTSSLQTEVAACLAAVTAANPKIQQYVVSPFTTHGSPYISGTEFSIRDAIKAAAAGASVPFLDVLDIAPNQLTAAAGTVQTAITAAGATSVVASASLNLQYGSLVQIGTGATEEIRSVSGVSGTGPYTISLNSPALNYTHAVGETVAQAGPAMVTGNGHMGATTGNGTADRLVGTDGTHPTQLGHRELGQLIARLWNQAVAG